MVEDISETLSNVEQSADSATKIIASEFTKLRNWFNEDLIRAISEILQTVEIKIGDASKSVTEQFYNLRQQLERDVVETTKETLAKVEEKVGSATTLITDSINRIRSTYTDRVVSATRDMLTDVEDRISRSQDTMYSLWEQAKSVVSYRFKDVWFVIGREGTMAQINETVLKAKARVLIVAPELADIDPIPLLELKKHVAVRIAAHINPNSEKSQMVMSQLAQRPNVEVRDFSDRNIWGITREGEETLVSAVSGGGDAAGIATIVDEHQKMFIPILEDCWLKGKKYLMPESPVTAAIPKPEPEAFAPVLKSPSIITSEELNQIFTPLQTAVKIGDPPKIVEAMTTFKKQLSKKYAWHVVLYEIDVHTRKIRTKELPLNQTEITNLLNKISDWKERLSEKS